jgi:FkbM family methyltransferase
MHLLRIPFSLWLVLLSYYAKKLIGRNSDAIQSNWIYFLRLALPLGYSFMEDNGKILIKHPQTNWIAALRLHSSDVLVYIQIFFSGEYNRLNTLMLIDVPTIMDIGANVGLFSLFAKSRWSNSRIIALEPEIDNYKMLLKQIELNEFKNLEVMNAAIWIESRKLSIENINGALAWSYSVGADDTGTIRGLTLREIIHSKQIEYIDLLKIDIEGAEVSLFNSDEFILTLKAFVRNLIMETHSTADQLKIVKKLRFAGFETEVERELIIAYNNKVNESTR